MGAQLIGEKKTRMARERTGLTDLRRLISVSNNLWLGVVGYPGGHRHVWIDRREWTWGWDRGCWTTCSEGMHGPYVEFEGEVAEGAQKWAYVHE